MAAHPLLEDRDNAPQPLLTTPPAPVAPAGSVARRGARWLLLLAASFVFGILVGLLLVVGNVRLPASLPLLPALVAILPLSWLHALGHELGHAAGARLVNFHVLIFAVGPLALQRKADGLRLERSHTSRYFGGYVSAVPVGSHDLRRRRLIVVAGGPIASVLLLVLASLAYNFALDRAPGRRA